VLVVCECITRSAVDVVEGSGVVEGGSVFDYKDVN
jgi:hypothetical protein